MLAKVVGAIINGSAYLEAQQLRAGGWAFGASGKECCYVTPQVIYALSTTREPHDATLMSAVERLSNKANADGGWGRQPTPKTSCIFATAFCCLAISSVRRAVDAATSKGITWIAKHQNADGAWGYAGQETSTLKGAIHGLLALGTFDSAPREAIDKALAYLAHMQLQDGGWANVSDEPARSACTASVLQVITEYGWRAAFVERGGDYDAAVDWLLTRKEDGFWRDEVMNFDTEATTAAVMALINIGYPTTQALLSEPIEWLLSLQSEDGSFPEGEHGPAGQPSATADAICALSKWLTTHLRENPHLAVRCLERLAQVEYTRIEKPRAQLKEVAIDSSWSVQLGIPNVIRVGWGRTAHFQR